MTTKFIEALTAATLSDEWVRFHKNAVLSQNLRFGQYICNNYLRPGVSWSELYYDEDDDRAYATIFNHLLVDGME